MKHLQIIGHPTIHSIDEVSLRPHAKSIRIHCGMSLDEFMDKATTAYSLLPILHDQFASEFWADSTAETIRTANAALSAWYTAPIGSVIKPSGESFTLIVPEKKDPISQQDESTKRTNRLKLLECATWHYDAARRLDATRGTTNSDLAVKAWIARHIEWAELIRTSNNEPSTH